MQGSAFRPCWVWRWWFIGDSSGMLAAVSTCTTINWMLPSCLASHMGDAKGGFMFFTCSHPFLAYPIPGLAVASAPLPCSPR